MRSKTLKLELNLAAVFFVGILTALFLSLFPLISQAQTSNNGGGLYCYRSFGHMISVGFQKNHGDLDLEDDAICVTLPRGIATKVDSMTDTNPPVISDVEVADVTEAEATITWMTNELASGKVYYADVTGVFSEMEEGEGREHEVLLSDLKPGTTYRFWVESVDRSGNKSVSDKQMFVTDEEDMDAPKITEIGVIDITDSSATITWKTDEMADSEVLYGKSMFYSSRVSSAEMTMEHSLTLTGLDSQTEYHFKVRSKDENGNRASSIDMTFDTLDDNPKNFGEIDKGTFVAPKDFIKVPISKTRLEITPQGSNVDSDVYKKPKPELKATLPSPKTN